ncbi:thymidylate synthase [Micromonospora trifolii]|uniref:thymidylate synthase n=1 Tax=Micromonospora trifolii TaxID=2911208 RepID=UPI003D2F0FCA
MSKASNFGTIDRPWRELIAYQFSFVNERLRILVPTQLPTHIPYCLGLLAWTLDARDDLATLEYYRRGAREFSDDGTSMCGAFGARLFGIHHSSSQIQAIRERLAVDPASRRTYATILRPSDNVEEKRELPCASGVQLFLRAGELHFITTMRAQQALTILPYDLFLFTALHHFIASDLGVQPGPYYHYSGTFHIYDSEIELAKVIGDGPVTRAIELDLVPKGHGSAVASELIEIERVLRAAALAGEERAITSVLRQPLSYQFNEYVRSTLAQFASGKVRDLRSS